MINNYSLSTAWNCLKHENGEAVVSDIKQLGFKAIELNFQLNVDKLNGIVEYVRHNNIAISSIHNYCPHPTNIKDEDANPDIPSLASNEEAIRRQAVSYTKQTIDTASKVNAGVVIIHSGHVATQLRTKQLIGFYYSVGKESKTFRKLFHEAIDDREQKVKEHFDALTTSCSELLPFAQSRNIRLGIENRFYHRELPSPSELKKLFRYFNDDTLSYWHDIGHAFVLEQLGFYSPCLYLESFHKKMIGIHLHDIINLQDHYAPFQGEFDWRILRRFNLEKVIKVIEVHSCATSDDILKGVKRLDTEVFR